MRLTCKPVLEEQGLAAPCDHASAVEVHDGWDESVQFWWEVEVELDVEGVDTRVSDCLHVFHTRCRRNADLFPFFEKCRGFGARKKGVQRKTNGL